MKACSSDHLNTGGMKSPLDDTTRHLGCISLPFIRGNDIVANLHHSCLVRSAVEPHAADSYLLSFMDNNAIPDKTRRVLLHGLDKKGERFQQIDSWPGVRNLYLEHLSQPGPLSQRGLLAFQLETHP